MDVNGHQWTATKCIEHLWTLMVAKDETNGKPNFPGNANHKAHANKSAFACPFCFAKVLGTQAARCAISPCLNSHSNMFFRAHRIWNTNYMWSNCYAILRLGIRQAKVLLLWFHNSKHTCLLPTLAKAFVKPATFLIDMFSTGVHHNPKQPRLGGKFA